MDHEAAPMDKAATLAGDNGSNKPERHLKERIIHEVKSFVVIFLYLWVVLGIFLLHEKIVLKEHDIDFSVYGLALVNALILGKVMLIAEDLHFADRLMDRPLVLSILYKSIAFTALFIGFYILEEVVVGLIKGKTIAQSFPDIGGGSLQGIFVVGLIMFVALTPFFTYRELSRVIGKQQLHDLMFKQRAGSPKPM